MLALRPTPKLKDHPLSAVRECLFNIFAARLRLKCDGTRAETRFRLSAKRTSPFKSARASVQSTTGSRGVHIHDSNAGYTMFRGSVKSTGYPLLHFLSRSSPCVITFQLNCILHIGGRSSIRNLRTGHAAVTRTNLPRKMYGF